jgi:hypothetical protein
MGLNLTHNRSAARAIGTLYDERAVDVDDPQTMVSILKGILDRCSATPVADPIIITVQPQYQSTDLTWGSPEDPPATNTTGSWSVVSLLKGFS